MPTKVQETLDRYASGKKTMNHDSDWKKLLKNMIGRVVIYSVLLTAIWLLSIQIIYPAISEMFTPITIWIKLVMCLGTLLLMTPFLWAQNVDFTSDPSQVLWSAFLNDNRYVSEKLGVFEGACTYIKGAYRPSEESMMNSNTEGFNAPSRKAIYDKIMERSLGTQMSYEEFAVFDLQNKSQTRSAKPTVGPSKPFTRPHFVNRMLDK